jgi:hypothetical protein
MVVAALVPRVVDEQRIGGNSIHQRLASIHVVPPQLYSKLLECTNCAIPKHHRAPPCPGKYNQNLYHRYYRECYLCPGVKAKTVQVIVAEFGVDMRKFPMRKHLGSWSSRCPAQYQSAAGKQKAERTRPGNGWLRSALVEAAWAAVRSHDNCLAASTIA